MAWTLVKLICHAHSTARVRRNLFDPFPIPFLLVKKTQTSCACFVWSPYSELWWLFFWGSPPPPAFFFFFLVTACCLPSLSSISTIYFWLLGSVSLFPLRFLCVSLLALRFLSVSLFTLKFLCVSLFALRFLGVLLFALRFLCVSLFALRFLCVSHFALRLLRVSLLALRFLCLSLVLSADEGFHPKYSFSLSFFFFFCWGGLSFFS